MRSPFSLMPREHFSTRPLLRVLGFGFGIAVTVGNTIGAGILRTPGEIAAYLPSTSAFLAVWVIAGLLPLIAASSFAELATMLPRAGGYYVFTRHALGEYPGFVVGWTDWLANCGSSSAVAIVIGEYTLLLFPALRLSPNLIACLVVIAIALLQWTGVKKSSWFQQFSSLLKAAAFLAVGIACFAYAGATRGTATPSVPQLTFPAGAGLFTAIVLAVQSAIYAYDGWYGAIYFSEETNDPARTIPRSIFAGTISIMGIYLFLNVALLRLMPVNQIAHEKLALGVAANIIWGAHGDTIIQAITVIAMLSALNAFMLMMCRIPFAMSRDALFPKIASHVNGDGTPDVALIISTLAALFFIVTGTFAQVVAVLAFFFSLDYVLALLAVLVLRRREPDRFRPHRTWAYPWTTVFSLLAYLAFLMGAVISDRRNTVYAVLLLGVSYPVYLVFRRITRSAAAAH